MQDCPFQRVPFVFARPIAALFLQFHSQYCEPEREVFGEKGGPPVEIIASVGDDQAIECEDEIAEERDAPCEWDNDVGYLMAQERKPSGSNAELGDFETGLLQEHLDAVTCKSIEVAWGIMNPTKVGDRENGDPPRLEDAIDLLYSQSRMCDVFQDLQAECCIIGRVLDDGHVLNVGLEVNFGGYGISVEPLIGKSELADNRLDRHGPTTQVNNPTGRVLLDHWNRRTEMREGLW